MKLHGNAALSFRQGERMVRRVVDHGWSVREAALAAEVSAGTAGKWVARYRVEGAIGQLDRSSAPLFVANRSDESTIEAIAALRRLRFTGPEISEVLEMQFSTVSGILKRIGMGRLGRARDGARRALRTDSRWRADPYRREEARTHPRRRREADHRRSAQPRQVPS
jgi:transposase